MDFQIVIDSLKQIFTDIVNFIPKLINGLIILFIGYLISLLVRWIVDFVLRRVKFDALIEKTGVTGSVAMLGIKTLPSQILSYTVFILLLLSFLITSTRLMGLEPVALLFASLLLFVPRLIAALIFFLIGGLVAQFVGNSVTALAAASGIGSAARIGKALQFLIVLFVIIISLSLMGLDTALLVTSVTILIAAFGLAFGLALGLGAKRVVQHILAGYYIKQRFQTGQAVSFEQINGTIGTIGSVNTIVQNTEGTAVFPNELLLESIILSPNKPSNEPTENKSVE